MRAVWLAFLFVLLGVLFNNRPVDEFPALWDVELCHVNVLCKPDTDQISVVVSLLSLQYVTA